MDGFYAKMGWVVFAGLLAGVAFASFAVTLDQALAVLWLVQVPLLAYVTAGIVMVFRGPRRIVLGGPNPVMRVVRS
jgi:hypothetical protein